MYSTINGWTKKSFIEHVKKNFKGKAVITNNFPSFFRCQYLTKDGRKCAVGLFIPDGHIGQTSSGDVISLLNQHPSLSINMPLNTEAMKIFQNKHDNLNYKESVKTQLACLISWISANVVD